MKISPCYEHRESTDMSLPCRHLRHENGERVTDEEVLAIVQQHDELMVNLGCALEQRDELLSALKELEVEFRNTYPVYYYAEPWGHETNEALQSARHAIANAEGKP